MGDALEVQGCPAIGMKYEGVSIGSRISFFWGDLLKVVWLWDRLVGFPGEEDFLRFFK